MSNLAGVCVDLLPEYPGGSCAWMRPTLCIGIVILALVPAPHQMACTMRVDAAGLLVLPGWELACPASAAMLKSALGPGCGALLEAPFLLPHSWQAHVSVLPRPQFLNCKQEQY